VAAFCPNFLDPDPYSQAAAHEKQRASENRAVAVFCQNFVTPEISFAGGSAGEAARGREQGG